MSTLSFSFLMTCIFWQDEVDKETIHLLVFLFMQFLSQPEQATIPGNFISKKKQKTETKKKWNKMTMI
jgi:hypothetical protein